MIGPEKVESGEQRVTLFSVTLAAFLAAFDVSSVNIALPAIGKEFSMDAISLEWVATAYLLISAMLLIPFGRVADIFGRKRVFLVGILTFIVASFSIVFCGSGTLLICFRVLQGIGYAMIYGTGMALLTSVFPPQGRGKALGINVAATYLGITIGPFLGGFLTLRFGWRTIFLVNVPLGLLIIALVAWKLRDEWAEAKGERFDLTGSIIYCFGLTAVMFGFTSLASLPRIASIGLMLAGGLAILAFIRWESSVKNPVLNVALFRRNRTFAFSNLAAFINYSSTFAVTFFLSLYLQYIKGLNPENAGAVLAFGAVVRIICSPFAGRLSDRIEPRIVSSIGMAFTATALFLLASLDWKTPLPFIVAALILLGLGFSFFASPNTNAVMSSVDKRLYGVASGTLGTMRLTGQMLSMGIAILLFALYIGHAEITPDYYSAFLRSMRSAFVFFGVLCAVGVLASLARGKVHEQAAATGFETLIKEYHQTAP